MVDTGATRRLLILACSWRKRPDPGFLPAIERYDGVNYRVLKRAYQTGCYLKHLDVFILSAEYGLIRADALIEDYDRKMTHIRADELRNQVHSELRECLSENQYTEMFLNMGKDYLYLLKPFSNWKHPTISINIAEGGIGQKMSQMKTWLCMHSLE